MKLFSTMFLFALGLCGSLVAISADEVEQFLKKTTAGSSYTCDLPETVEDLFDGCKCIPIEVSEIAPLIIKIKNNCGKRRRVGVAYFSPDLRATVIDLQDGDEDLVDQSYRASSATCVYVKHCSYFWGFEWDCTEFEQHIFNDDTRMVSVDFDVEICS